MPLKKENIVMDMKGNIVMDIQGFEWEYQMSLLTTDHNTVKKIIIHRYISGMSQWQ